MPQAAGSIGFSMAQWTPMPVSRVLARFSSKPPLAIRRLRSRMDPEGCKPDQGRDRYANFEEVLVWPFRAS
jgi:hypothetical protein